MTLYHSAFTTYLNFLIMEHSSVAILVCDAIFDMLASRFLITHLGLELNGPLFSFEILFGFLHFLYLVLILILMEH